GVSVLVLAWNGSVIVGTFPEGKFFRVDFNGKGEPAIQLTSLGSSGEIWGLAYDAKSSALYAATGSPGKLFRVTADGRVQEYFSTEEPHFVSVAVGSDAAVYAGSTGSGL